MPKVKSTNPPGTTTTRKRRNAKKEEEVQKQEEHVIVQLPIQQDRVNILLEETNDILNNLEYCPKISDPTPYDPFSVFTSHNDEIYDFVQDATHPESAMDEIIHNDTPHDDNKQQYNAKNCCFWCCHSVGPKEFGLPIKYDTVHKTFTTYGSFCSLHCVVAYNYNHYMGSDRMWEIHSWIQWMAQKMGYDTPIRPAPNKYLLKMFNGPMDIEEFRDAHKNFLKTYVLNMPPLIHVQGQMEVINTSYLNQKKQVQHTANTTAANVVETAPEKMKLARKRAVMDMKKTLDAKMNLTVKQIQEEE